VARAMKSLNSAGFTLVESMAAMAILAIAAVGALGYQYHAATQARLARAETLATQVCQLLLEDWKSTGGSLQYDPSQLELGFVRAEDSPEFDDWDFDEINIHAIPVLDHLSSIAKHNTYGLVLDDFVLLVILDNKDVGHDEVANVTLRQISVVVLWTISGQGGLDDFYDGPDDPDSQRLQKRSLTLSTYVRVDSDGG